MKASEIEDFDLLFLKGTTFLAKGIKFFQKMRFPENQYTFLNHVGFFYRTKDGQLLVYEQDNPGRFQASVFDLEYIKNKRDVYVGRPLKKLPKEKKKDFMNYARSLAGGDYLLNYSYKSYFGFMSAAITQKLFKKPLWITGTPKKGSTCSQIIALLYQKYFHMFTCKKWWKHYPCDIAASDNIKIYKFNF